MPKRSFDYITSAMIAVSSLFLIFYALATHTTLFTSQGSDLNQGYIGKNGDTNLNNVAVGALVALGVAVVLNRLLASKQSKGTRLIREAGITVLLLAGVWFLIVTIIVIHVLASGQFFQGWQF